MNPDQWASVETHFAKLHELPTHERQSKLAAIPDQEVRREVASLLGHSEGGETVHSAIGAVAAHVAQPDSGQRRVGPYRLLARVGQGGQGAVFEAVRDDGVFHNRVALKIVKWEIDSEAARERFRKERQILADLQHPNIARLLDGGETEDGAPYLVMEYVDGQPITAYCARLEPAERLRLFLKVCAAVDHAHRNLVVHRDLKPGNILVASNGDPKLLDFGIAKLLDPEATKTQTGLSGLTPEYASPEQVRGKTITTASDVYSLGVVLYQLLTGRKPYMLETATAYEMDRVICVQPPAPPALGDELDHIILMALRKEPERRYGSVAKFAEDIERYLDNLPVRARPDTTWYRTRKYARRHWVGLTAASIALAGILIGAGVAVYQARIAQQRFQQVRKLANTFLFQFHDAIADIPGTTKARELVVTTALQYLGNLANSAGRDDDLKLELAKAYERVAAVQGLPHTANLGDFAGAKASYTKALALYDQVGRRDAAYRKSLAGCLASAAALDVYQNDLKSARSETARAAAVLDPLRQDRDPDSLAMLARLYDSLAAIGYQTDLDYAEENVRKGLAQWEEWAKVAPASEGASVPYRLSVSHGRMGIVRAGKGWLQEGAREQLASLRFMEEAVRLAPSNSNYRRGLADNLVTLASLYGSEDGAGLDQPAEAARYARQAAEVLAPLAAADAHDQAIQVNYACALMCLGQALSALNPSQGMEEARHGMQIWRGLRDTKRLSTYEERSRLFQTHGLVRVLTRNGRAAEALDAAQTVVSDRRAALASSPPESELWWDVVIDMCLASVTARAAGHTDQAHAFAQQALAQSQRFLPTAAGELTTAYDAAKLYSTLEQDREAAGNCAEAADWRAKERELWRGIASKSDYAPVRLQAVERLPAPCAGAHR